MKCYGIFSYHRIFMIDPKSWGLGGGWIYLANYLIRLVILVGDMVSQQMPLQKSRRGFRGSLDLSGLQFLWLEYFWARLFPPCWWLHSHATRSRRQSQRYLFQKHRRNWKHTLEWPDICETRSHITTRKRNLYNATILWKAMECSHIIVCSWLT